MSENINLTYNDFSAGQVAGDGMTIIDKQTTLEDIINWVFSGKSLWFYDGQKYRAIIHFEDIENGAIIYYFNDSGEIISHQFGGDS